MTVKDFYEWACENCVEDFDILIQYRDGGGYYSGYSELLAYDIDVDRIREEITI